jgi:hypothetical protein
MVGAGTDEQSEGFREPFLEPKGRAPCDDRPRHRGQLHPCRDRHVLRDARQAGGGVGRFDHLPQLHSIEGPGVRPNRDTLYSEAVFDLDAGPVEITLPDPGDRFLSMLVIDEDHYVVMVVYGGGRHTLTRDRVGTRYVLPRFASWSTPMIPATSRRFMPCRIRSPPASRPPAASRSPTGPGQPEAGPRRAVVTQLDTA